MLEQGLYDDENELCNDLALNYEDIYEDEVEEDDDKPQKSQDKRRGSGTGRKRRK